VYFAAMNAQSDWIFLGLGANLGDRARQLRAACAQLAHLPDFRLLAASALYETPPWGMTEQPAFLNQVLAIHTSLNAWEFLEAAQTIELALGRTRHTHWGPRTLDIDILAWGQLLLRSQRLNLPHPFIAERAFVLRPWADIAPDFHPPGCPDTVAHMLAALPIAVVEAVQPFVEEGGDLRQPH
jgi:2-amino-4-hydroxy-6-hydroxymethyldihydropteridine diphosphokinase